MTTVRSRADDDGLPLAEWKRIDTLCSQLRGRLGRGRAAGPCVDFSKASRARRATACSANCWRSTWNPDATAAKHRKPRNIASASPTTSKPSTRPSHR